MKTKNIPVISGANVFVLLVISLCLLKAPLTFADAESEKLEEIVIIGEYSNDFDEPGIGEVNNAVIEEPAGTLQQVTPADEGEGDMEELEFLATRLLSEKQRLAELESEHKKLFDEIMTQPQQDYSDKEDALSEEQLLTTIRQDAAASASSSQRETIEQSPKIDYKDLAPDGNVDLLGTADGLYKLLQYEAALQIYHSIDPEQTSEKDNSWILYQIANCYRNLNQFDDALNTYKEILEKYPNTYPAKEAHWYLGDLDWWKQWYEKAKVTNNVKATIKSQSTLSIPEGE